MKEKKIKKIKEKKENKGKNKQILTEKSKKTKVKKEKKTFKISGINRKNVVIIIVSIILIAAILGTVCFMNLLIMNKKYKKYEEKMDLYGFSFLYNNEEPKTNENVTKLEIVKQALGSIYNVYDASYIGYQSNEEFDGDEWVKTAVMYDMLKEGEITAENYNDKATYWDFIKTILDVRAKKLKVEVAYTKESEFKNLSEYNNKKQRYINDLVEKSLIESSKGKIRLDTNVKKGQVNEIVVKLAEKYGTILKEGETLVTKKESMPSNYKLYPYIIYSVPKEIYELKHYNQNSSEYKSPAEIYNVRKEYYDQMDYRITNYYKNILNIDYKTINLDQFKKELREYTLYRYDDSDYEEYIKYVKENKIVIEGKSEVLEPIIYFDSIDIRVRTKITFEIKSSDTDKNILFGDKIPKTNKGITYKDKKYTLYVDVPMSRAINVLSYFVVVSPTKNILSDITKITGDTL